MKIYPPFSGALAAFGAAYFTAVLCGVCGIREWGALIVTVAVGGLTCGAVNSLVEATPKKAPAVQEQSVNQVSPLPDIESDPLAIEINEAAVKAGIMSKYVVLAPFGSHQINQTYYIPKEKK